MHLMDSIATFLKEPQQDIALSLKDQLQLQIKKDSDVFIEKNYDREAKEWKGISVKEGQQKVRQFKTELRWLQEAWYSKYGDILTKLSFIPLVNLRNAMASYPSLDLILSGLFKFTPDSLTHHTYGNWECRGCLNTGLEGEVPEGLHGKKHICWCPRYMPILRTLSYRDYAQANPKGCYAGLLHSEMSFDVVEDKKFLVVTKKCDMCSYEETSRSEVIIEKQTEKTA